jgi:cell division protein FtsW
MAKRVSVDKWMFGSTLLLVFIGLIMVFSASAVMAGEKFGSPYTFLLRQLVWAIAGVGAMVICMNIDYRKYKNQTLIYTLLGITLVLLIAVFFVDRSHGAHRWVRLGVLSFQPSELAKPAIILFLAFWLEPRIKTITDWKHTLMPAAIVTLLLTAIIVKQPDLGTGIACVAIATSMLFVAGMEVKYIGYAILASILPMYWLLFRVAFRRKRMLAFLDPNADPLGTGFHMIQSLIAVSTGGITGQGLMEGKQKLFYLPEPHTDFIFAVTAEELGLVGSIFVVILFAIFLYRGIRAAVLTEDTFGRLLATGITAMVVVQAFFNVSVVLGLLPTKGIPLPFISYGGSSLFITLASVGVLLNITQQTE